MTLNDKGWNKYWIRSLQKQELTSIVMKDARDESPKVIEITRQALETMPNLTKTEIENQLILEEDILI